MPLPPPSVTLPLTSEHDRQRALNVIVCPALTLRLASLTTATFGPLVCATMTVGVPPVHVVERDRRARAVGVAAAVDHRGAARAHPGRRAAEALHRGVDVAREAADGDGGLAGAPGSRSNSASTWSPPVPDALISISRGVVPGTVNEKNASLPMLSGLQSLGLSATWNAADETLPVTGVPLKPAA